MDDKLLGKKVVIREFNEEKDSSEVLMKLVKSCKIGSQKGVSIFTNMMDDPLCRIRFYTSHVMLVAELPHNSELIGMVGGCIKCLGTGFGPRHVKFGCILSLRVSPKHRRMGIGLKLVQSIEEWSMRNGAQYIFLATEEKNVASTNLFTLKCSYINFSSLSMYVQPLGTLPPSIDPSQDIQIEMLPIDEAISLYKTHLKGKDLYPKDIDVILKEKMSMGTWLSYFKDENRTPSSWAIFSIWNNTCEAYKLQVQLKGSHPFNFFHAILSHARKKIFSFLNLKMLSCDSLEKPFGFLFLYGLHGEGERLGELMESVWSFALRVAANVKDCKAIITELGVSDPLREYVPKGSSMACIDDLWYLKKVDDPSNDEENLTVMSPVGNVFVDPRDF